MCIDPQLAALEGLFAPRSIAVIGASRNPKKWGHILVQNTINAGFQGQLYGVNPTASAGATVAGIPLVARLTELAEPVDCAVIGIPRSMVLDAMSDCVRCGVKVAIIVTAGFGETGEEGRALQARALAIAREGGLRLIGPNCLGVFRRPCGMNLTPHPRIPSGPLALVAQSGNIGIALFLEAEARRLGFSTYIGLGNQMDIGFGELLHMLARDEATRAVGLYIEGLPDGEEQGALFLSGLSACHAVDKPVIAIKAGRTAQGAAVAYTHTGSLAADDRVWQTVLESQGAMRVESTEDLMDALECAVRVPITAGRIVVISDGGGHSVLATDAISESKLALARLNQEAWERLDQALPFQSPRGVNPIDTAGGMDNHVTLLTECLEAIDRDRTVDIVVLTGIFGGYGQAFGPEIAHQEMEAAADLVQRFQRGQSIAVQSTYASTDEPAITLLKSAGIPVFSSIQRLVKALTTRVSRSPERSAFAPTSPRVPARGNMQTLSIMESQALLRQYGIPMPPLQVTTTQEELLQAIEEIGYPACVKLADPQIGHKSDVHAVYVNLIDGRAVQNAARELQARFPQSQLLVMPSFPSTLELLVGVTTDPLFGPLVMVGRGGIWTEIEQDVALRLAPLDESHALDAIRSLRCYPMLAGSRGQPALAINPLADLLLRLSRLVCDVQGLSIDLNPVFLYPHAYAIADIRAVRVLS